ncbi:TIGR02117 family protein [Rhizobium sp. FY34]|uniref:TIGR02117 family protein n=1 Tax=Rhizobium sp. FY34 TaxID=2562309 RepID=UPI0010C0C071|nr:TIGR02117 family protein [Rhizobium sp. FY34]
MNRLFRRVLILASIPIFMLVLGTLVPRPLSYPSGGDGNPPTRQILLLHNPIHTDIALRLDDDLRAEFSALGEQGFAVDHPNAVYLVLGWGGRAFYIETPTWGDLKPGPVVKALTLDRSVMHVNLAGEIPRDDPAVRRLVLSEAGYRQMLSAIKKSFATDAAGSLQPIADAAYGENDMFFEANGRFNALLGCNTWTGAMLRAGGLRTGWWTPLPPLLTLSLDLHD